MAKEKFVRSKPHFNVGSWFKEKLGLGTPAPVEPPIEPLESDNLKGMAFNAEEALGASAIKDTDGGGVPEIEDGWQETFEGVPLPDASAGPMMPPRVGWEVDIGHGDDSVEPDKFGRVKVEFPSMPEPVAGGGENEPVIDDTSAAEAEPHGQNDDRFWKSRAGHQMESDGGGTPPDLDADDAAAAGTDNSASVWTPVGQLNVSGSMSEPPEPLPTNAGQAADVDQSEADADGTDAGAQAAEKDPLTTFAFGLKINSLEPENQPGSYLTPEVDDEVLVGFEHGEPGKPVVVGGLWNGQTGTSPDNELEADEASDVEIKHEHVYQHNQTDLQFLNQKAGVDGEPDGPLVIGPAPNPEEEASTLAELKVSGQLVPLDSDDGGEGGGLEDVVRGLPELDD